ncbi:MAG TPA: hypothetical protein VLU99_04155 [Nitrososphaerales archaeon]|nr:hypothetical protein [Nitrososphaerales archaeon]
MPIAKSNRDFQGYYYIVGTGMIRMPSQGIVYSEGPKAVRPSPSKSTDPQPVASQGRLTRLLGIIAGTAARPRDAKR